MFRACFNKMLIIIDWDIQMMIVIQSTNVPCLIQSNVDYYWLRYSVDLKRKRYKYLTKYNSDEMIADKKLQSIFKELLN